MNAAAAQLPANMRTKIKLTPAPAEAPVTGDCWAWQNCINSKGYGCTSIGGKRHLTHRVAYTRIVGKIPAGLQLDHLCRNRRCCNPAHLEPVTAKVNVSRNPSVSRAECLRGHALVGDNVIVKRRGALPPVRNCRQCANDRRRVSVRRQRQAASA